MVLLIILSLVSLSDRFYFSKRYFPPRKSKISLDAEAAGSFNASAESISKRIKDICVHDRTKSTVRVLFIGTSQTWGAGARDETETFVNRFEEKLNSTAGLKRHFECVNAGICGSHILKLLNLYKNALLVLEPQVVVIILSNNDNDPTEFSNALRSFADLNISKGVKTVFVLEANSIERAEGELGLHKFMRQVGKEKGIPVLDLHGYLAQNYDKGFLWWDSVHLTSFGQKLTADFLFENISREMHFPVLNEKRFEASQRH